MGCNAHVAQSHLQLAMFACYACYIVTTAHCVDVSRSMWLQCSGGKTKTRSQDDVKRLAGATKERKKGERKNEHETYLPLVDCSAVPNLRHEVEAAGSAKMSAVTCSGTSFNA